MRNILSSLEAHKSDITLEDFAKFKSAKLLGMKQNELIEKRLVPSVAAQDSSSEDEKLEGVSGEKPVISQAVREQYEDEFVGMDQALMILKKDIEGQMRERAAEDSDEEVKERELRQHNEKLLFINMYDSKTSKAKEV